MTLTQTARAARRQKLDEIVAQIKEKQSPKEAEAVTVLRIGDKIVVRRNQSED